MSGNYYPPSRGLQDQRGLKRTYMYMHSYGGGGDAGYMYSPYNHFQIQSYGHDWLPPNHPAKRRGSSDLYSNTPNKVQRTENARSYSTSSVPSSLPSSSSRSYLNVPHSHTFMSKTVVKGQRAMSSSSYPSMTGAPLISVTLDKVQRTLSSSPSAAGAPPLRVTVQNGVNSDSNKGKRTVSNRHEKSDNSDNLANSAKLELESGVKKRKLLPSTSDKKTSKAELESSKPSGSKSVKHETRTSSSVFDKVTKTESNKSETSESKSEKHKEKTASPALDKNTTKSDDRKAGPSERNKNSVAPEQSQENSRRIWSYYVTNKQTKVEEHVKEEMRMKLQQCINQVYPRALLILGGSSLNGFGSKGCDADLCLYLSDYTIGQKEARQILLDLRGFLQYRCSFIKHIKVIFARVPILKFQHKTFRDLDCDLNINHLTGVRNTALLQAYSKLDWRVAPLVMLIKQWAKNHGINDASQGTLSSYSYVLMIINYLQVGCQPPVVQSIQAQEWGRIAFSDNQNIVHCWNRLYDQTCNILNGHVNQSKNSQDLYTLLKGFFAYYANFDFENTVISIRLGSCFPCRLLPPNHQGWRQKYIFIEEPFDRINTARSVFDLSRFEEILDAFQETHGNLCNSDNLDIERFLGFR